MYYVLLLYLLSLIVATIDSFYGIVALALTMLTFVYEKMKHQTNTTDK